MKVILALIITLCMRQNAAAQEIRLDSLWAKQGGVAAMTFTPDSKTLLIGEDGEEGQVTVHNVTDGSQRAPFFLPGKEYSDFKYTPDGKYLVVAETKKIVLVNPQAYDSVGVIENVEQIGFLTISDDSHYAAVANYYSNIVVVDLLERVVKAVLTRPDKYNVGVNQTMPYLNGRVSFSPDGKYIIGKYENSLVRWDWRNTPSQQEIIIGDIGNRALIGFSPDKKYFVQQSNYIWDLVEKKQISIEGMQASYDENSYNSTFTTDGKYLFCLDKTLVTIVNLEQKKVAYATGRFAMNMAVSADNSYYTFYRPSNTRVYRMTINPNSVNSELGFQPTITINPMPSKDFFRVEIETQHSYTNCTINIISSIGAKVGNIYQGDIFVGKQVFTFSTSGLSPGQYTIVVSSGAETTTIPFIITKQ